eukprot:15366661-Alexandrium_andersonii.AAC.1
MNSPPMNRDAGAGSVGHPRDPLLLSTSCMLENSRKPQSASKSKALRRKRTYAASQGGVCEERAGADGDERSEAGGANLAGESSDRRGRN